MLAAALLALTTLPDPELPAPPAPPAVQWLPRVTLRLTHRGSRAYSYDASREEQAVPWGTTFQVFLEWGGAPSTEGDSP